MAFQGLYIYIEGLRVLGFRVSKVLGFWVYRVLGFRVSRLLGFRVHMGF